MIDNNKKKKKVWRSKSCLPLFVWCNSLDSLVPLLLYKPKKNGMSKEPKLKLTKEQLNKI